MNDARTETITGGRPAGAQTGPDPLGIYLNDHLAGSTAGLRLARRMATAHRATPFGAALARVASEIAEDRDALLELMRALGVPERKYKITAGWAAEAAGRLKSNGRIMRRSALSTVIELETLRIGVAGKSAAWRTLLAVADRYDRLGQDRLDVLLERARRQAQELDELRITAARAVFCGADPT
ncbi:hypothetical protein [Candidatus Frankia alpina]|uniref:Uncharacterized protein n=1 Tax=Candidatus Frankia alpina TaxID=2699483 RepID=A0A4S5EJB0_9ACTN|nr:hypothetical protein [Candidatus Frankia alpina]THJ72235.1 hypothetical protein E7Y31_14855 [Candidatus Frankia alpina]